MPGNIKPTVALLKEIKLFSSFSNTDLSNLLQKGAQVRAEPHANIVIEGELSWGLYIILEGTVGVFKTNKLTGHNYDIGQLGASNFFGEMSLIDDNPRSASVKTFSETDLFFISKESFNAFLDTSPQLRLSFYANCVKTLVNRLRDLDDNYVASQYQLWESALKKESRAS